YCTGKSRSGSHRQMIAPAIAETAFAQAHRRESLAPLPQRPLADDSPEILVERIQRVRLDLGELTPQLFLDPVHHVKQAAAVEIHARPRQLPIRAQHEHITEELVLDLVELAPGDEAEIGHELFILSPVHPAPGWAWAELQGGSPDVGPQRGQFAKTGIAGAKNGPQNATARRRIIAQTVAAALRARRSGEADCVGTIPKHGGFPIRPPCNAGAPGLRPARPI